ncbi:putative ribonuclease H-like domain-containing protein [Tanacetum coccineum]
MKIDLDDKTDVLTYHKKLLADVLKEKDDLKTKFESWKNFSKNLDKLLDTQMSANDKFGLGYGDHRFDGILSYENEVLQSVFMNKESDLENENPNDSDSETRTSEFDSCELNSNDESPDCLPPVETIPIVVNTPKVWTDAPVIEEYESDDECELTPSSDQQQPKENVQEHKTCNQNPKVNQKELNGQKTTRLGLGYGHTRKACFVCGSFSHLIRDCDFHEKKMARKYTLNKKMSKDTHQKDKRPTGNNVQKVNPIKQFVPTAVLTRSGKIPINNARSSGTKQVNTARQNVSTAKQNCPAVPTKTAKKVSTESTKVNDNKTKHVFKRVHSQTKRPFSSTTTSKTNFSNSKVSTAKDKAVSAVEGIVKTVVKASACCIWRPKRYYDDPQRALKNKGIVDSGCSRHMTGNKSYLVDYQDFNGGPVAFGGSKGQITGKGKIRTGKLDFDDLPDENQVLLRVPRQHNMYDFNLENFVPSEGITCLIAKATTDESNKWHRRLGHVNFKNLNKLVKGNLVRGLPSKIFQNDQTCVACQKGKQHKASCKAKTVFFLRTKDETSAILKDFIRQIENQLNKKVKTIRCDNGTEFKNMDMIEFCGSKGIKREYSNARTPQQNGVAERKNRTLIEAARTMLADSFLPNTFWAEAVSTACYVLNRVLVTKPHNKTPYELITGKLPIISYIRPFGCHATILNTLDHLGKFEEKADEGFLVGYSLSSKAFRVYNLETKRVEENLHVKFLENKSNVAGKGPTWLFDLDYLTDSMNYQHVTAENRANKPAGLVEDNNFAGIKDSAVARTDALNDDSDQENCVLPIWSSYTSTIKSLEVKSGDNDSEEDVALKRNAKPREQVDQVFLDELEQIKRQEKDACDAVEALRKDFAQSIEDLLHQAGAANATSTNQVSTDGPSVSTASPILSTDGPSVSTDCPKVSTGESHPYEDNSEIPALEDMYDNPGEGIFTNASYDGEGAVADFINLESTVNVSPIPTSRIHTIHPTTQILGDPSSAQRRNNHKDFLHCLFACFLSQVEPKKIADALEDESWVDAMQEELLQFQIQKVYRNKKDKRGVVVQNKARLVSQGHRQEEGIRIFLAFASYMGFIVYQMDVKSAFLYGTIDEEVYVSTSWPLELGMLLCLCSLKNGYRRGTIDKTLFLKKDKKDIILVQVYVDDIIFGSTRKSWCDEFEALMKSEFQMSSMGELTFFLRLQVKQRNDGIFISQDKYVAEILNKFDFVNVKTASTPIET